MDMPRVVAVEYLGGRILKLTFSNHRVRELDFANTLNGVLQQIDDDAIFPQVAVDPVSKTLAWPNGIDLDPDVLSGKHEPANGQGPTVLADYGLETST